MGVGWQFLSSRASTSKAEYSAHVGVPARTAVRHLNHFIKLDTPLTPPRTYRNSSTLLIPGA